jgi:spermidine synthase
MGKISIWQRLLSYFKEIHIESAPSELNPHLYVSLSKGRYMLSSAHAVYSHADLYHNFGKVFDLIQFEKLPGKHCLILGLGLGSIPILLEKRNQKLTYVAVEKDPSVIYLASKYALPDIQSPLHVYEGDASTLIRTQENQSFDMICMDIFVDDVIPKVFRQSSFLEELRRLIHPKGLIIINVLKDKEGERPINANFMDLLNKQFPKGQIIEVGPNTMFVSDQNYVHS